VTPDVVLRVSRWATIVFVVTAVAAAAHPDVLDRVSMTVAIALSVAGCVAFARALLLMADRSRQEELSVAGVFFLTGSAPVPVRRALLGDLAVQVVVALATATARPYSPLAFGVLVPVFGLGMCGLWGATAGRFPPRTT
jgi:hypothetical protein